MQQLQRRLPQSSPQDLSNSLWALAKLRVQPPQDWLQDWVAASAGLLGQFSGQAIGNAVWGLVKLGHRPGEAWVQRCLTAMHYLPQEQASEQDWSTLQVRRPGPPVACGARRCQARRLPEPAPARARLPRVHIPPPRRPPHRLAPRAVPAVPAQVALYKWGFISEDGVYEELGDGRMLFTANIDEAALSPGDLQRLQAELGEGDEAGGYEDGPWGGAGGGALQPGGAGAAVELSWYGVGGEVLEVQPSVQQAHLGAGEGLLGRV
jgi:hypothetical protein